jgi:carbon-monoxide dehydrogenase large subunit
VALGIHYAILAELANQVWMFSGGSIDDRRFSLISVSVKRQQDVRLLTGRARYVADIDLPGMLEAVFVRSPMAHAGIRRIDLGAARAMPGVHATVASSDLLGVSPFPDHLRMARGVAQFPLAVDRVRYVGTPVATVVADDRLLAADASEAVIVDYETLPVVSSIEDSLAQGAPLLYDDWPDNRLLELSRETPEIDEIFARSKVVSGIYKMHRHGAVPMETRGVVADYDGERLTVWSSTQQPFIERSTLSHILGIRESKIRVVVPSIGGGFGAKLHVNPENAVVAWLAMRLGRPVRWIETRAEHLTAAAQSREQLHELEAAIDEGGRIEAIRCRITRDLGSGEIFPPGVGPALVSAGGVTGPYRIPLAAVSITGVVTNKTPAGAYRGYGMPEIVFALERFIEKIAGALGRDPLEYRREMLIRPEDLPYRDARGKLIDSGSHLEAFDQAVEWGRKARHRHLPEVGHRIGIGYATYVEGVGPSYFGTSGRWTAGDGAQVRIEPDGNVTVSSPVIDMGQGTKTMVATVAAEALGVSVDDVEVRLGDTDVTPYGLGSFGARSSIVAAGGIVKAAIEVRAKALQIAAHKLEAAVEDLAIESGHIHVRGSMESSISFKEVAAAAYFRTFELPAEMTSGLSATAVYESEGVDHLPDSNGQMNACVSYSNSTHVAVVDIDLATCDLSVIDYLVVHDCGPLINPEIVEGQIHGGVAQGIGGAIFEQMLYTTDGQPRATSLADYLVPGPCEIPRLEVEHLESPSPVTPLGIKGAGEAGATGPAAAIGNAVADALGQFEVEIVETPLTPQLIWTLLKESQQ